MGNYILTSDSALGEDNMRIRRGEEIEVKDKRRADLLLKLGFIADPKNFDEKTGRPKQKHAVFTKEEKGREQPNQELEEPPVEPPVPGLLADGVNPDADADRDKAVESPGRGGGSQPRRAGR